MGQRIRFADGKTFYCAEIPFSPVRRERAGDREWRRIAVVSSMLSVMEYFVDGAQYVLAWDSATGPETTDELTEDLSEYSVAGDIIDHRDGTVSVYMGKPTKLEVSKDITAILSGGMEITKARAAQLRAITEAVMSEAVISDDLALEVPELFPAWSASGSYKAGQRVRFEDGLYHCVQNHSAQSDWTPDVSVSLWNKVTIDPVTGYDDWKQPTGAQDAYNTGYRVVFEGATYESIIDGNVWSPTVYPAGWSLIH